MPTGKGGPQGWGFLARSWELAGCRAIERWEGAGNTFAFLDGKTLTPFDSCFDSF